MLALDLDGKVAVVTGAAGFFGRAISRELARRGFRVRGIGRSERPDDPHVHEWVRADLAREIPADALAGAGVVVHAAAETAGGFEAHERNTVGVTRQVLGAMAAARVYVGAHYPGDVAAGLLLGGLVAALLYAACRTALARLVIAAGRTRLRPLLAPGPQPAGEAP